MLLDVLPQNSLTTLVWTRVGLIETSARLVIEVMSECTQLAGPLAASLVVRAVHLEPHHTLLKVNISKVVEVGCFALGAGIVDTNPLFDTTLAKVTSTAHHLTRIG